MLNNNINVATVHGDRMVTAHFLESHFIESNFVEIF